MRRLADPSVHPPIPAGRRMAGTQVRKGVADVVRLGSLPARACIRSLTAPCSILH